MLGRAALEKRSETERFYLHYFEIIPTSIVTGEFHGRN